MVSLTQEMAVRLEALGLHVNDSKSGVGALTEGFTFLGYCFDTNGKRIPAKAEKSLQERLDVMWLTTPGLPVEDKLKKALEIIGGWEQYYRDEREPLSILEFAALVYTGKFGNDRLAQLVQLRRKLTNPYRDLAGFLTAFWKNKKLFPMELLEYEQLYEPDSGEGEREEPDHETGGEKDKRPLADIREMNPSTEELLEQYRSYMVSQEAETAAEIMQLYTDLGEYRRAEYWQSRSQAEEKTMAAAPVDSPDDQDRVLPSAPLNSAVIQKYMTAFAGREDIYSLEGKGYDHRRVSEPQMQPLTESRIRAHLAGDLTICTYIQRPNATVHYLVFDIDISKRVILQYPKGTAEFAGYLKKAWQKAAEIQAALKRAGLRSYAEFSGYRGCHVWVFFTEWIQTRYVVLLSETVLSGVQDDEDVAVEIFPNKTKVGNGRYGQALKLPYGMHIRTGERSYFLQDSGQPVTDLEQFLDGIAKYSLGTVKRILAANPSGQETGDQREVDPDLNEFGQLSPSVAEVLQNCSLMRYLCQKARKTGYLPHMERLSVLYVFGHLGEEGKEFVHKVMSFTLNYQFHVTERFIRKLPEKPISCVKLRDQYKKVTAEIGCSCMFQRSKNCYPSPVLHAISSSDDLQEDVTLPTSRSLSKEKEKEMMDDLNIHKKAQDLSVRIQELRKQKRGLDKLIQKIEKELEKIFDSAAVDSLEIEMGLLVRRKTEEGYEWLIEL